MGTAWKKAFARRVLAKKRVRGGRVAENSATDAGKGKGCNLIKISIIQRSSQQNRKRSLVRKTRTYRMEGALPPHWLAIGRKSQTRSKCKRRCIKKVKKTDPPSIGGYNVRL